MHNLEVHFLYLQQLNWYTVYRNAKGTFFGTVSVTSSSGLHDIVSGSGELLTNCCPEELEPWANSAALSVLMYALSKYCLGRLSMTDHGLLC